MVVEQFPNFFDWIGPGLLLLCAIALSGTVLGIFLGYVVASFKHGPFEAFYVVAKVIAEAIPDFLGTSPRRIMAIARLSVKEAIRRRVILVTFGIFAAALLFGGWFMNAGSDNPDQIYVNFVLWGTQLLVLLMGMLISAFSLPEDIKNKTIYTIVTKPVRSTEIVIGRILGFAILTTSLLALMALISFAFVWRGLSHNHRMVDSAAVSNFYEIDPETRLSERGKRVSSTAIKTAETTFDSGHRHRVEIIEDIRRPEDKQPEDTSNIVSKTELSDGRIAYQRAVVVPTAGHTHRVAVTGEGDEATLDLGPATGYFRARVPIYAEQLMFYDREGAPNDRGIDVGKEWSYRGYVDGGSRESPNSLAKADFQFENFDSRFIGDKDILPLEMSLGVFRTYKGDIEKRVIGSIQFESVPNDASSENRFQSDSIVFETNEFQIQTLPISRQQPGRLIAPDGSTVEIGMFDLFEDYARNGKLNLVLRCEDYNQYIGVARADVYFRATDDLYWANFFKGYLGIWCQMIIVIAMGVSFSTFLSAPITMLATLVTMIIGFFTPFIRTMTEEDVAGGGPIESLFRLVTQKNMEVTLETGIGTTLMEQTDNLLVGGLSTLTYLAPNFAQLNFSDFLTYGYSIDSQRILVAMAITIAFCMGLSIVGYFCLKTREIAK
ncbi:MAG: hypothetical protein VYE64_00110 [Planctomycetota bacterium]|nr:hypothetical protein [Planctomycetota bacterium]